MSTREPHYENLDPSTLPPLPRLPLHLVLDNLRSAYNVGSMFRTGDAAGVCHIHLTGMSAHPPHKKLEKTALGAFDYVPWTYYERTSAAIEALQGQGIAVVAVETSPKAVSYLEYEWPQPAAIIFGNEVNGIRERHLERCDAVVRIPMTGYKNTLNVATACGIVLFEVARRWGALHDPLAEQRPSTICD